MIPCPGLKSLMMKPRLEPLDESDVLRNRVDRFTDQHVVDFAPSKEERALTISTGPSPMVWDPWFDRDECMRFESRAPIHSLPG